MTNSLWQNEQNLYSSSISVICGIDEAGRGPLAGPVCAAAVILPKKYDIFGINDSKKLSPKKREELYDVIREGAADYGIAFASVEEIESLNILNATMLAMKRAYDMLSQKPELVIIDGNASRGFDGINNQCIVGGDGTYISIAAASILAKVTRDRFMTKISDLYPKYNFSKHKGYGTKEHIRAILDFGPCPAHRASFLQKLLNNT